MTEVTASPASGEEDTEEDSGAATSGATTEVTAAATWAGAARLRWAGEVVGVVTPGALEEVDGVVEER